MWSALFFTTTTSDEKREEGLKSPSVNLSSPINMPSTTHQDLFPLERENTKNLDGGDRHASHENVYSPLLNSVESLDLGNRDKDNNSLLSTLGVNLLGGGDLELPQLGLELGDILLEVDEGLSDGLLDLGGSGFRGVGGPLDLGLERHDG
jgi:hypothetical protein